MNVFVLCTGRCGSTTFTKACTAITNFSVGHERNRMLVGEARWQYPEHHIEIDNRLSWMLGALEKQYGDDAVYIHLIRSKNPTVSSFNRRWNHPGSLMRHFVSGILDITKKLDAEQKRQCSEMMYDVINDNIRTFLIHKSQKLTIEMETWHDSFPKFWQLIAAEGDLDTALQLLQQKTNTSQEYLNHRQQQVWYNRWGRRVSRGFLRLIGK